jgi:hypothetical protein
MNVCLFGGAYRHFQQYFSYIELVLLVEETTDLSQVTDKL